MQLPATPEMALSAAIDPALKLLPTAMTSDKARVLMLAILQQESGLASRVQYGGGPARGLAMFEQGGGVRGVLTHPSSASLARRLCAARACPASEYSVWASLAGDDLLACGFARLLLWTDPAPLPAIGDADGAWAYYQRLWRPGRPRPERWVGNYAAALAAVRDETQQ